MALNDIKTSAATELAAGNSSAATEHTGESQRKAMAAAAQAASANEDTVFNPKTPQMVEARKLMTELLRPIMTSRGFDQEQALQWVQAVKEGKIPIKKSEEDAVMLVLETAEAAQELAKEMRTPTTNETMEKNARTAKLSQAYAEQ